MAQAMPQMTHHLVLTRNADKGQRKLDKPLRTKIREALLSLCHEPESKGEKLSQPLTEIYSHHVKYQGKEYRIAYLIEHDQSCVVVLLIGPHENFYRKVKQVFYS